MDFGGQPVRSIGATQLDEERLPAPPGVARLVVLLLTRNEMSRIKRDNRTGLMNASLPPVPHLLWQQPTWSLRDPV
jgi:hypothetical protein